MWVFEEDLGGSRMIREYGEYSELELSVMKSFITSESVVLEVGAHIGAFTIPLARVCKKVYAVEPQKEVAAVLQKNLDLAGVTNVEILPFALGFKQEERFYTPNPAGVGSVRMEDTGTTQVDVVPLDSLNLSPDFIKIDVEGMELDVLAGGMNTITTRHPYIFAERSSTDLPRGLTLLGYVCCQIDLPVYVPNNWKNNPVNHYPNVAHQMYLGI